MTSDDIKVLVEDLRKERIALEKKEEAFKSREEELKERLTKVSKMTPDEAKKILLDEVQKDLTQDIAKKIRASEEKIKLEAQDKTSEIRLSSFDSIRREIAKRALENLIKDSRIQPSRIEEVVKQTKLQMEDVLLEEGKKIAEMS